MRLVLAGLLVAAAAAEYGAPMPHYGAPDYALPDDAPGYNYHDDTQGNIDLPRNDISSDTWKNPARKYRYVSRRRGSEDAEEVNSNPKYHHSRHHDEPAPRRHTRRGRRRGLDAEASPPLVDYGDKPSYHDHKDKILEDDIVPFTERRTTERIIRRKPRDRYVRPLKSDEIDPDEGIDSDKNSRDHAPIDYAGLGRREWDEDSSRTARPRAGTGLVPEPPRAGERDGGGDRRITSADARLLGSDVDELSSQLQPRTTSAVPERIYDDYRDGGNYYDMKRVLSIKNKLPSLLRRPTLAARGYKAPESTPPAPPSPPGSELVELLYGARRAGSAASSPPSTSAIPPEPEPTPAPTLTVVPASRTSSQSSSEPSLAERSRLSILKKAQKKEGSDDRAASKPPVLLQVTSKVQTVVMVEPPFAAPWLRARVAPEHSARQLQRVKRLMRRKLVAGARSVQDLANNWDDMVCDYIDTALVDDPAADRAPRALTTPPASHLPLATALLVYCVLHTRFFLFYNHYV